MLLTRALTQQPREGPENDEQLVADLCEAFDSCEHSLDKSGLEWATGAECDSRPCSATIAKAALSGGTRLGDFEIIDEVGCGGMGVVYRARQMSLQREVALKVLPDVANRRRSAARRFRTEAEAVARLGHPNVVPVYAQGEYEGHLYYAMELIHGVSLDVAIHSQPERLTSTSWHEGSGTLLREQQATRPGVMPGTPDDTNGQSSRQSTQALPRRTLADFRHIARLVSGVADGLAHAHDNGVVHRDIKPHNLLLGPDGRLHITDFGLAYLMDEPHATMTGEVMGTAAYLSPEQIQTDKGAIDHRTDIYSLGATLYEAITGHRPFDGETRARILTGICTTDPTRPRRWDKRIPLDLEVICLKAMEKNPTRRYSSAAAMADDLRRFAGSRPILSRRNGPFNITMKWVRRHPAVTTAITATAGAVILGAGLIHSAGMLRHTKAENLLRDAYERLVYLDYREPDLVAATIERAESLGADPLELNLVQALAKLGASDEPAAIDHLSAVLDHDPHDMRALYMLAWAQWRAGDHQGSFETLREAKMLGGPDTADAWFLRGLATHFNQPAVAGNHHRCQ